MVKFQFDGDGWVSPLAYAYNAIIVNEKFAPRLMDKLLFGELSTDFLMKHDRDGSKKIMAFRDKQRVLYTSPLKSFEQSEQGGEAVYPLPRIKALEVHPKLNLATLLFAASIIIAIKDKLIVVKLKDEFINIVIDNRA
ncbi:WD repeat domain-containing protein [Forsythia ovata]|uniref:WD repeat domain-containing protein n=1 Tax=Forsythia ovata TaxID=205694 RepID=A0ABD1UXY4_9LAMI